MYVRKSKKNDYYYKFKTQYSKKMDNTESIAIILK